MAKKDPISKALQTGKDVTGAGQKRVEGLVRDLTKVTDKQTKQVAKAVEDLVDRSRENTERLAELVSGQVRQQLDGMGLARRSDIDRLEGKLDALTAATATKAPARSAARKAPARKAAGTRPTAKGTTAGRAASRTRAAAPPATGDGADGAAAAPV